MRKSTSCLRPFSIPTDSTLLATRFKRRLGELDGENFARAQASLSQFDAELGLACPIPPPLSSIRVKYVADQGLQLTMRTDIRRRANRDLTVQYL